MVKSPFFKLWDEGDCDALSQGGLLPVDVQAEAFHCRFSRAPFVFDCILSLH